MCAWRIDKKGLPLVGFENTRSNIEKSFRTIKNEPLKLINVINDAFDLILEFGDDTQIYLFSFYIDNSDQWVLFNPDNTAFCAGPKGTWHSE